MKTVTWSICLLLGLVVLSQSTFAESSKQPSHLVKAVFLINFCKFVDWPAFSQMESDEPIVIGVWDPTKVPEAFDENGRHLAQRKQIIFRAFHELGVSETCHVLYLNTRDSRDVRRALSVVNQRPILTVGEIPEFVELGGIIRFFEKDSRIRFEINLKQSQEQGLRISSQLLALGRVISLWFSENRTFWL